MLSRHNQILSYNNQCKVPTDPAFWGCSPVIESDEDIRVILNSHHLILSATQFFSQLGP